MEPVAPSRWLSFPRVLWMASGAACLLGLFTVGLGFFSDDFFQLLVLEGYDTPGLPGDLFHFASGDPRELRQWVERGPYPWWTLPELKLSFWRPLSSALARLDHALFGRAAWAWHLHSVLWYVLGVAAAGALLRRALPGTVGALALLLFAIDGAHAMTVGWLANRNALVALAPALMGLALHLRWRESRRARHLALALTGLAVGLFGGESALGVFAYLVAHALVGEPGGWKARASALAPAALLGAVYLGVYKAYGYGSSGSGSYVDPLNEPVRFMGAALGRIPTLLGGLVLEVPADLWAVDEGLRPGLVLAGLLALLLLLGALRGVWPELTPEERRALGWLGLGAALSLLPVAATFPSNRLLLVPGVGGMAAVAAVLVGARRAWARGRRAWGVGIAAGVLGLVHGLLAPLLWPVMSLGLGTLTTQGEAVTRVLERQLDFTRLAEQRVAVLALPQPTLGMYLPAMLGVMGVPRPAAWWTLSIAPQPHVLTRTGPASLELRLTRGHFLASEFETVFRAPTHRLAVGERVRLSGLEVGVLEVEDGGPTRLGFTFDVPLEDESLVLLTWREGALHRFVPPPEGEPVQLSQH